MIWLLGICAWAACGLTGWRIVLYRFGRNLGAVDDAMIGPCMLIGPVALWIALSRPPQLNEPKQ